MGDGTGYSFAFSKRASSTTTDLMTLTDGGNLGIGTSSPAARLEAYNSSVNGAFVANTTSTWRVAQIRNDQTGTSGSAAGIAFVGKDSTQPAGIVAINGNTTGGLVSLAFLTVDSNTIYERARIDSSGNLGIGTTSPTYRLTVLTPTSDATVGFNLRAYTTGADGDRTVISRYTSSNDLNWANSKYQAWAYIWETNGTEKARITSGGDFLVGDTTASARVWANKTDDGNVLGARATNASYSATVGFFGADRNTTNNSFYYIDCYNYGAAAHKFRVADSGNVTNTNGSYGTISDAKMKTDIVDAGSQWADVKGLRFRKFKMKDDPSGLTQLGVVAQEVGQVSPGLVDEHADRDAEGNDLGTTTKSVKTSVLLMKAAVALQEAMTRIEQLEAKVAALESK
jgi:hypothetical protein